MENASYALRIAGGVLIAIMVVSLMVFGFSRVRDYKKQEAISKKDAQIAEFNKEFESYNKKIVRGYELVSLANYINDMNTRYSTDEGYTKITATIKMNGDGQLTGIGEDGKATVDQSYKKSKNKTYDLTTYVYNVFERFSNKNGDDYQAMLKAYSEFPKELSNVQKEFKELYFKCSGTTYDEQNGRVCKMEFQQIVRTK